MSPKHIPHFHSQNRALCRKFTKHAMLSSPMIPVLRNTPPNRLMITELFRIQLKNVILGINNDAASTSKISIERNLATNKGT